MLSIRNMYKYYPTALGRKYVFRNVSLEVAEKSNIGVLGLNGSGKSTLIRLLSGSEFPNRGDIRIEGSVSWPLGLSGGVQGALTGRENAEFVCTIYGADNKEVSEKLEFIKDFSELDDYFELPVNSYSSGMNSRLKFAMSMAFDFDVYLIDELTAVGDARFREKSRRALKDKHKQAHYIMVSHNINELISECDSLILLIEGELNLYGDIQQGLADYKKHIQVGTLQ